MRLNVYIAKGGCASRRKADILIKEGQVEVNHKKVTEPFYQVVPGDKVKLRGKLVYIEEHIYILFNKPEGVTTTLSDRFAKKKVIDYLPDQLKGVYPVGRLDKDSRGLLILTNDGDFCYSLTHPKFFVEKEYLVEIAGELKNNDCQKARKGLNDQGDFLKVDNIKILKKGKEMALCKVIVHEGKKRHLRRLFKSLGFEVTDLKRTRMGRFSLGSLKPGEYRIINKNNILKIHKLPVGTRHALSSSFLVEKR
ncbi:MAG: pseudouridine synthase [Candidatus Omnitrophota bacterium]